LQDEYKEEATSVIGSDFYGATELLNLSDEQIVEKVLRNVQRCEPRALGAKVGSRLTALQWLTCYNAKRH